MQHMARLQTKGCWFPFGVSHTNWDNLSLNGGMAGLTFVRPRGWAFQAQLHTVANYFKEKQRPDAINLTS